MKLFEDLPSQDTPITAESLNQIKDKLVVVSATEPTGDNREKVWIQKGKNLFNKNNAIILNGFLDNNLARLGIAQNDRIIVIPCMGNTTYTISKSVVTSSFRVACYENDTLPILTTVATDYNVANLIKNNSSKSITITTSNNAKYLFIHYGKVTTDADILEESFNSIQVEQNSTATEYEDYIEHKIYVLNDNGVYEEFISKEDIPSGVEQYDITLDCGLALHFFKYGKVVNCIAEGTISSLNKDTDQACNIPKEFAPVYAFRHALLLDEGGIIGYININTVGYLLIRSKTDISSNKFPRFSFSYITGD